MREHEVNTRIRPLEPVPGTAAPDPERELALDERGNLAEDVECRFCGYNLRGLQLDGECPECLTSVRRSVHGNLLRFCDPDWVEKLASGMRLFVVAVIATIVVGMGTNITQSVLIASGGPAGLISAIAGVVASVLVLTLLVAYWLVTTPDPGEPVRENPLTARVVARWAIVIGSSGEIVLTMLGGEKFVSGTPALTPSVVFLLIGWFVVSAAGIVGMIALLRYAASLASRMPDEKLRKSTNTVMWGYVITTSLLVTLSLLGPLVVGGGMTPGPMFLVFGALILVFFVAALVFWIWGLVLAFKYRNRFIAEAGKARATWARAA